MWREDQSRSRGASVGIDGLQELVQKISLLPEPKPIERRTRLWSNPWWGGFILVLLTVLLGRAEAGGAGAKQTSPEIFLGRVLAARIGEAPCYSSQRDKFHLSFFLLPFLWLLRRWDCRADRSKVCERRPKRGPCAVHAAIFVAARLRNSPTRRRVC